LIYMIYGTPWTASGVVAIASDKTTQQERAVRGRQVIGPLTEYQSEARGIAFCTMGREAKKRRKADPSRFALGI